MKDTIEVSPDAKTFTLKPDRFDTARMKPANDVLKGRTNVPAQRLWPEPDQTKGWRTGVHPREVEEDILYRAGGTAYDRLRAYGYDVHLARGEGRFRTWHGGAAADFGKHGGRVYINEEAITNWMRKYPGQHGYRDPVTGRHLDPANPDDVHLAIRQVIEHEEVHALRASGAIRQSEWDALIKASKKLKSRDGKTAFDSAVTSGSTRAYKAQMDELVKNGFDKAEADALIKRNREEEVVAQMIGNRAHGELPATPEFLKAAKVIEMIRDTSIAKRRRGLSDPRGIRRVQTHGPADGKSPPAGMNLKAANDPTDTSVTSRVAKNDATSEAVGGIRQLPMPGDDAIRKASDEIIAKVNDPATINGGPGIPTPRTFDSLTHEGQLRAVVDTIEDDILKEIEGSATARGPISHEESIALAKEFAEQTGEDAGILIQRLMKDSDDLNTMHARLLAYDRLTRTLASDIRDLAVAYRNQEPGAFGTLPELEKALHARVAAYSQVQDWLKGVRSEVGRTLGIMRISRNTDAAFDVANSTGLRTDDLVNRIMVAGNDRKLLGAALDKTRWEKGRDAIISLFVKSILSGAETHIVNNVSNAIAIASHPAQKIIGGAMAGDRNVMAEGVQQYVYLVSEAGNALSAAVEAWKRGNSILDPMMDRFGQAYRESLTAQNLGFSENSITGKLADGYFSVLDKVSTKALGAEDEFWKRLHFNSELQARAWSEGVALGLEKKELRDFVAGKLKAAQSDHPTFGSGFANPDDALGQSVLSSARDVTFTQPIKFNSVSGHLLHFTSAYPTAKFVVPFVRVLDNLMNYSASMTPGLHRLARGYKEAIEAGGRDAAVVQGRLALGSAIWTMAIVGAMNGNVSGAGPKDYRHRQAAEQSGKLYDGVRIPGTDFWINAKRFDPIGLPFNIAGRIAQHWQNVDDKTAEEVGLAMSLAIAQAITDRHYMQGLMQFFGAMSDNTGSKGSSWIANTVSAIAVPNFIAQNVTKNGLGLGIGVDPYMREAVGIVESIERRLPVLSQHLAVRRLPWGDPVKKRPGLYSSETDDALMKEYARLIETGNAGNPMPLPRTRKIPGDKALDLSQVKLNDGRILYDVFADYVADPDPGNELPLRKALEEMIASDEYKHELIDGPGSMRGTKLHAVQRLISAYRKAAWNRVIRDHPEIEQRVYRKRRSIGEQVEATRRAAQLEAYDITPNEGQE